MLQNEAFLYQIWENVTVKIKLKIYKAKSKYL